MLNERILYAKLTINSIFLVVQNKILIFQLDTLEYVSSLEDVDTEDHISKISMNLLVNPLIIAYVSWGNRSMVKINRCK